MAHLFHKKHTLFIFLLLPVLFISRTSFAKQEGIVTVKKNQTSEHNQQADNKSIESAKVVDIKDLGGDFSLIGKSGWVSLSDFKGKVVAIYFGYTMCPDVCPTNLSFLSSAIKQLKPAEKNNFQSIFISVDPGRDTPDKLVEYVKYFDQDMIGLSAAPDDLDPVVVQYGAYYEKVPFSNSALMYGIDHTSETYIVGKDGKLFTILPHATKSVKILKTIRQAIKQ